MKWLTKGAELGYAKGQFLLGGHRLGRTRPTNLVK